MASFPFSEGFRVMVHGSAHRLRRLVSPPPYAVPVRGGATFPKRGLSHEARREEAGVPILEAVGHALQEVIVALAGDQGIELLIPSMPILGAAPAALKALAPCLIRFLWPAAAPSERHAAQ